MQWQFFAQLTFKRLEQRMVALSVLADALTDMYVCLSFCFCLSIRLSVYLSGCLSVCMYGDSSICLYVYPFV